MRSFDTQGLTALRPHFVRIICRILLLTALAGSNHERKCQVAAFAWGFNSITSGNTIRNLKPVPRQCRPCEAMANNHEADHDHAACATKETSRSAFLTSMRNSLALALPCTLTHSPHDALSFEGGVGGLGKTKPELGIVFRDDDAEVLPTDGGGVVNHELVAPDGATTVLVSFFAPWPMLRSKTSIESRDLASSEAAYVQVVPFKGKGEAAKLPVKFFQETLFGQTGKFGMYGAPTDVKVKQISTLDSPTNPGAVYVASFTTLTPSMRESDRKAYISATIVGDGVFMLVTGTTSARFKKEEALLRKVAESFRVVVAPTSSLRSSSQG